MFTVIVCGAPQLATALNATHQFAMVVSVDSTSGLRNLIASKQLPGGTSDKIFIFADTTLEDTEQSLALVIQKLSATSAKVVVLGFTPAGSALVSANPSAGLVSGNIHVNAVLGALASLGVPGISPLSAEENTEIHDTNAPTVSPAPPVSDFSAPTPAPPSPFANQPASPFEQPAAPSPSPFANQPYEAPPAAPSVFSQQASSPFDTAPPAPVARPSAPFATPEPSWSAPAPVARTSAPEKPPRKGFVITVTAAKGGAGKSSLTLNLAAWLALYKRGSGQNVCIIDANVQQADVGKYLGEFRPNIEDILRDPSTMHPDRISSYLLHKDSLNLSALLGPATPDAANPAHFTGERYAKILEALRPNFDYIFIDTPVAEFYHPIFRFFALPQADFILVAANPNLITSVNTDMWLRQVTAPKSANGMGIDRSKVGLVLNRAEDDIGYSEDDLKSQLSEWRYLGSVPDSKEWRYANNKYELIATKNVPEISSSFARVLSGVLNEDLGVSNAQVAPKKSLFGKLFGKKS